MNPDIARYRGFILKIKNLLMSHTYNDVMTEISRINSAKVWLNVAVGSTFGVSSVTADSSLADLSTNIGLIDTDPHPDYALPWIMADGSSAFVVPVTMGRNRGADVTVSLVPHPDNAGAIVMTTMTSGAQWGLNQLPAGMRGRYRMDASPGNTPDTNNYAGLGNAWSDSSCPYWHRMKFALSHYDNTFRCSLYQAGSWTHAASSMNQASTSGFNSLPIAVFGSSYVYNDKVAMRPNGNNKYFSSKGTMLYDITFTTGTYDSSTIGDIYMPVLHWDRVYKKYRPCLYESANEKYSSFAIGEGDNFPDDGRDGAYYIAPDLTIMGDNNPMTSTGSKAFATNIPNKAGNKLIVVGRVTRSSSSINPGGQKNFVSVNSADSTYNLNIYMGGEASGSYKTIKVAENSGSGNVTTTYFTANSNASYFTIMYTGASNSLWYSYYSTSALTTSNAYHNHKGVTRSTLPTQDDSLRGNYTFRMYKTTNDLLAIYAYIIYDSNDVLTNYVVPCLNSSNSIVLYDVITKTLYT